eukprot:gene25980-47157_t
MRRFATVLAIACVSFVLLPTAPPWMAAGGSETIVLDALPPLERPAGRGWDALHLDSFVHAWETGRDWANPVAAMPSLHAAFSLMGVAFWLPRIRRRWVRAAMLVYPLVMGVALVYLAEHWVVDVLAGWAVVGMSFALWAVIERRFARRHDEIVAPDDVGQTEAVAVAPADNEGAQDDPATIGVVGGSGFYEFLSDAEEHVIDTPFGSPASPITIGTIGGHRVAFLARHGRHHEFAAHRVPFRANVWALHAVGVRSLIAPCSVGS